MPQLELLLIGRRNACYKCKKNSEPSNSIKLVLARVNQVIIIIYIDLMTITNETCFQELCIILVLVMLCRFYTEDANSENSHRAAGMTIELRDTGRYGFELPPSQVYTTCRLGNLVYVN